MAGGIFTSSGTLLPTSTIVVDYLVERMRPHLPAEVVASAYAPMDEGGMNFISFESLSPTELQNVIRIITQLYKSESVAMPESPYLQWWERLLNMLLADARASV